ncbi:MAG: histidine kinase [Betaproteobacteria bacterium]|nr:histidine kinase [Betaproteobacteria bacterium]
MAVISPLDFRHDRPVRIYYPRSFLVLLAVGFTLVALPLVIALVNNAISIDQLANRSQQAVYRAVQATQSGRRLAELSTAMERSARQMVILGDRALLDSYALNRKQFLMTAAEFSTLPFDSAQKQALDAMVRGEDAIFAVLSDPAASPERQAKAIEGFVALGEHAQAITQRSNQLIDREVEAMRATAARAQRIMLWQLLALIPVVVFLVIGFTILIARPIRQIDSAIRRLGGGEFGTEVRVAGPEDLQYLGERLDWMRRRLLELEEQKNRFLRQMSHELKTPLTALREGAELLSDEVVGQLTPEQREIAEILRHNSIELQKLIEDLLSYGASHFQKDALEVGQVQLKRVINRVADDQRLALRAKNLKLDVDAPGVALVADFEKLRVILDNLISNAIKFSPAGGMISITGRADGACLELDVADEGPGIPPAVRSHVFEPFYRGAQPAHGRVKGTGIGLSVVREYAAAHGGSVEVVEQAGKRGARLRVRLPLAVARDGT